MVYPVACCAELGQQQKNMLGLAIYENISRIRKKDREKLAYFIEMRKGNWQ